MPPHRLLLAASIATAIAATAAGAREIAPAVEIEPIGFSQDGRYFAYEELLQGDGNAGPAALVHVLDRTTNKSAPGFPFGLPEREDEEAAKAGDKWQRLGLKEDDFADMPQQFEKLRAEIRKRATPKLEALAIAARPRRVAGTPFTQSAPAANVLSFKLQGELLGAIPAQQPTHRLRAAMAKAPAKCFNAPPATATHAIALTLETFTVRDGRLGAKPDATIRKNLSFDTKESCPQSARISDIFAAPAQETGKQAFVAALFVHDWQSHADTSRILATFFEVE